LTITPTIIKDKTECPGVFCPYTGSDLLIDATHPCKIRTSGAQKWEAWIKDARDDNKYRIVLMPDQKWYMAQNLNYRDVTYGCYGDNSSNCNEANGVWYPYASVTASLCPTGWRVPTVAEWSSFISVHSLTNEDVKSTTRSGNDTYGLTCLTVGYWSPACGGWCNMGYAELWWTSTNGWSGIYIYNYGSYQIDAGCIHNNCATRNDWVTVRCFRQL
jgi:uncharacterized protein (TIGR02145 family)